VADWRWVIVILIKRSSIPPNSWFPSSSEFPFSSSPSLRSFQRKAGLIKRIKLKDESTAFSSSSPSSYVDGKESSLIFFSSPFGIKSCTVSGTSLTSTQAFILSSCWAFDWFPFRSRDSDFFFIFSSSNSLPVGDSLLSSFQTCDASYSLVL